MKWLADIAHAQIELGLPFEDPRPYATFNDYFSGLINFAVIVAGLLAVLVIVYAGMVYTQSQGQADRASYAKELIAGALTGLALLLMIRLILPTLNIGQDANTTTSTSSSAIESPVEPGTYPAKVWTNNSIVYTLKLPVAAGQKEQIPLQLETDLLLGQDNT